MPKAYEILCDESKWTRRAMARLPDGKGVCPIHSDACQWCLAGILEKIYNHTGDDYLNAYSKVKAVMKRLYGHAHVWLFNDDPHTTFEMVHRVLVEADV